jgi:hypothetical protein
VIDEFVFLHNLWAIKPIHASHFSSKSQPAQQAKTKSKMNFFIIFFSLISLASATLQGIYINKMSNAVASFNANRYRAQNNNNQCDYLNQTYNFLKNNAQSADEIYQIMMAYRKVSATVCRSQARPKRRFRGFARKMYFKNMQ